MGVYWALIQYLSVVGLFSVVEHLINERSRKNYRREREEYTRRSADMRNLMLREIINGGGKLNTILANKMGLNISDSPENKLYSKTYMSTKPISLFSNVMLKHTIIPLLIF